MSSLQSLIINSDYEDLRDLVFHVTGKFARRYSIPFDDLIGPAHTIYVREYSRFDSSRGAALSSWLHTKLWYGLMSFVRKEIPYRIRLGYGLEPLPERNESDDEEEHDTQLELGIITEPNNFRVEIESELSSAARDVVNMLLDARNDLQLTFAWHTSKAPRVRSRHMLRALREHLIDLGWPEPQIKRVFGEIRGVLRGGDNFWKR